MFLFIFLKLIHTFLTVAKNLKYYNGVQFDLILLFFKISSTVLEFLEDSLSFFNMQFQVYL